MRWMSKEEREAKKVERAKAKARRLKETQERRREEARHRREKRERRKWEATDHGRAQLAFDAGELFFQMQRVISETTANVFAMVGAEATSAEVDKSSEGTMGLWNLARRTDNLPLTRTLAVVEDIGWVLAHVGYTYRETYSESRDKFLKSGQQIATSGEIVAIYLFRRSEKHEGQELTPE